MKSLLKLAAFVAALTLAIGASVNPAFAAFSPTYTFTTAAPVGGSPGGAKLVTGTITFGASDTYVTGGLTIAPSNLGLNAINFIVVSQVNGQYSVTPSYSAGAATVKFNQAISGASNIAATATTATVTVPAGTPALTANTPIFCQLNDAATAGGGTGTWAVTNAVSSCKFASTTTFTITSIAAAPTNGGNFVYYFPNNFAELTAGTTLASVVVPFTAYGN